MAGLILRQAISWVIIGLGAGVGLALLSSRILSRALFGVSATDVPSFLSACVVLCAVSLVAACLPVRKAAQVDPMIVLRHD